MSDGIETHGSVKCLFAGFVGARDRTGVPCAGNSGAIVPEEKHPPGMGHWLVLPWGSPEVL